MAGKTVVNTLQIGDSATASQNFHLETNLDGSLSLNRGNDGAPTQEVLKITGTETVQRLMTFTAQAATSGTSIDFTGIPSWAKEISVMFSGVSTSGSQQLLIQLGTSSGFETSGYSGTTLNSSGSAVANGAHSVGVSQDTSGSATYVRNGLLTFSLLGANTWAYAGNIGNSEAARSNAIMGSKPLGGVLDRIRVIGNGGTDVFDAGAINILVKG